MPLFFFTCSKGHKFSILRTPKEVLKIKELSCKECGEPSKRTPKGASGATVKEGIDTGLMPKKLERLAEADRLFKDHNKVVKTKQEEE